jgi:NAD(P)-dependent dehydrogenase (short-subunit alcohol dehydrogenase family)
LTGRVSGKTALVTGAAQGLGAATAQLLARQGARMLLTDINEAGAAQQAAAINAECGAGTAFSIRHDVTSEFDWLAALELAREALGGLSVLVNNAGSIPTACSSAANTRCPCCARASRPASSTSPRSPV